MKYLFFILFILYGTLNFSQSFEEALRYSMVDYGATARNLAVGSSMGALGADISAVASNPAGLAEFRRSEFSISLGVWGSSIDATLLQGSSVSDSKTAFSLPNIALTFVNIPIASPMKTSNFTLSLNKIANFNNRFTYSGSTQGTMVERFLGLADGYTPDELDDFAAGPAYVVGAIYDFDEDYFYESDFDNYNGDIPKTQNVETKGGINEFSIGWAGNIDHKVSVGFSIGLPFYSYEQEKSYLEVDDLDNIDFFNELQYDEFLRTSGFGINGKFGIILKPQKQLRISAAFHSPSLYFLTDDFYSDILYSFTDQNGIQTFEEPSPDGNFKYQLSTPWKANGGIGYIFGFGELKGFVSAEIEYIDNRSHKFNLTVDSNNPGDRELEDDLNNQIDEEFEANTNWRLGGELAYKAYRFRAGYQFQASPYRQGNLLEGNTYSAGLGIRGNTYFFDIGIQYRTFDSEYFPYYLPDDARIQLVDRENKITNIVASFGYKI